MKKTLTEKWIEEDQPLYDVTVEELIFDLLEEGHSLDNAVKLVETLGVKVKI